MRALLPMLLLLPAAAYAAPAFSPTQRAEIVAILRQALTTDPSILRDAILALQKDQQQQEAAAHAASVQANLGALLNDQTDQVAGNPHARHVLVEFFDVNCPYCRRMLPDMTRLLSNRPDVALVLKDLPVLGPSSILGAKALLAARNQGNYYLPLQQALMAEGTRIDDTTVRRAARAAGLDPTRLEHDMQDPAIQAHLDRNTTLAKTLGIEGTPALVINGQLIPGAMTYDELQAATKG